MKGILAWLVIIVVITIANGKKKKTAQKQAAQGARGAARPVRTPGPPTAMPVQAPAPGQVSVPPAVPEEELPLQPEHAASPFTDPLPREGHEECDSTEGSLEIPGRSPEGVATEGLPAQGEAPAERIGRPQAADARTGNGVLSGGKGGDWRRAVILKEILDRPVSMR